MDDYYDKCIMKVLRDEKTYQRLKSDPTNTFKKEFVSDLKDLKNRKVIHHPLHMKLYSTVHQPNRFYGLPKIYKANRLLLCSSTIY